MIRLLTRLLAVGFGLALGAIVTMATLLVFTPYDAADLERGDTDSYRLYDRHGTLLRESVNGGGSRARWTQLRDISGDVVAATIAVEDARFRAHPGVDVQAIVRAALQNLTARRVVSGASTITMQLSRLVRPHPKSLRHKVAEAFDALRIESVLSKDAILEQYLNRAPYGAGTIGIEAAAHRYFGTPSTHLSLAQAALLSGLPKAPTALNPTVNLPGAIVRQRTVLRRMLETGVIDRAQYERARSEAIHLSVPAAPAAMHFTDWVLGRAPSRGDVHTTVDSGLQTEVEGLLRQHVQRASAKGGTNAAVVVLDNQACEVRAMVGSAGYWTAPSGAVNGAVARRQPGSTLKPFAYALAFERGDTPATPVADIPTTYADANGRVFAPQNFSRRFSGPVLMGEALARSLNVPAVRVVNRYGARRLLERLQSVGFDSLDRPATHYGLGLVLGNGEVTLLELATGYAALARGGRTCAAHGIQGREAAPRQAFTEEVAFLIGDVLSDERLRIAAFGPSNALMLPFPIAAKTGTSSNWRDTWAIGYTDRFTVAVWTGDFSGRSTNRLAGVSGAGPLFAAVARRMVERDATAPRPTPPSPPSEVEAVSVCARSGLRPSATCPHRRTVHAPRDHLPAEICTWHDPIAIDRRNGLRASDRCPQDHVEHRVVEQLPAEYAHWQATAAETPLAFSPHCPARGLVTDAVVVTNPRPGEVFIVEPGYTRRTQTLAFAAEVSPATAAVTWWLDGEKIDVADWPYEAAWKLKRGHHRVVAVAAGRRSEAVRFEVR